MNQPDVTYEVQTGVGERWVIDSIHIAQTVAMSRAQELLTDGQHESVRVMREAGQREEVVFQQECVPRPERPITASPIEEAAVCASLADLTKFEARKTAGRVLRRYLDKHNLTALEVLFNHDRFRDLRHTERLFDQAIHKVGSVQARTLGVEAQDRIDLLYRLGTELFDECRDLRDTDRFLSIVSGDGLAPALRMIGTSYSEPARTFYIYATLAAFLGQARDWQGKLTLVIDLMNKRPDEDANIHLDELCAEILDGSQALTEILGRQPDLVTAMRLMACLAAGRFEGTHHRDPHLVRLNAAIQQLPMVQTRRTLLDRVARETAGTHPLTREDDAADRSAFPKLVDDLASHAGLNGGPHISEAVTRRARIVMGTADGDLSADEGIEAILALLPTTAVKLGYLLDLSHSGFGEKYRGAVLTRLLEIVEPLEEMADLLPPDSAREALAAAVDDLRTRVGEDALGQEIRALIAKKLDGFLDRPEATASRPDPQSIKTPDKRPRTPQDRSRRTYKAGDVIFSETTPGDEAFVVVSGKVEISIGEGKARKVIASLDRGEVFGEMALIDDEPRMATATAASETVLYVVPQEVFKKRLDRLAEEDSLISHIVTTLVGRLRGQFLG